MAFEPAVYPFTAEQEAIAALVAQPTEAVTVRAAAFRAQVKPGQSVPYFAVRPGLGSPGVCPSCGEPWPVGGRCLPCKAAALMVVEEQFAVVASARKPMAPQK